MKRYITSSGSASMGVSTVFDTEKESLRNKFLKPFESKYQYYIVLFELFSLYKKVPAVLSFRSSKCFIALHSHRCKWLKLTAAELKKGCRFVTKTQRDSNYYCTCAAHFRGSPVWNNLSAEIKSSKSVFKFKSKVKNLGMTVWLWMFSLQVK